MVDYNSAYTGAQIDANLAKAATAVQPAGLATVATTGAYGDLSGKPTLGTAAAAATGDFATAAQGTLAGTAVQPTNNATVLGSGSATNGQVLSANGSGGTSWATASGGGGTPGGSTTQLQFNDGGAFGGDSGLTFDKTAKTLNVTGATIAASDPIIDMAQTWNNAAVAFTALKLNVTDTASAAGSLLMDLQVGGVSKFKVDKAGDISISNGFATLTTGTFFLNSTFTAAFTTVTGGGSFGALLNTGVQAGSAALLGFSSGSNATATADVILRRDAANTLAQRNGVNAQAFNLYNTYTDASNYERGFMRFVSNTLRIGTEKLGTGTARALELQVDGTTCLSVSADLTKIALGSFLVASGGPSTAIGRLAIASGAYSFAAGHGVSANGGPESTGAYSTIISQGYGSRKSTASGVAASIFGGVNALADKFGQDAYGFYGFAQIGDAQTSTLGFVGATANDTATEIFLFNVANQRAVVPANKTWAFVLTAVARSSGGTDNAMYVRRGIIKRDGANNTALVRAVDSVYTNETNAAWDIDVSADDTNESLKVTVTGAAATNIRWVAKVELTEVLFA